MGAHILVSVGNEAEKLHSLFTVVSELMLLVLRNEDDVANSELFLSFFTNRLVESASNYNDFRD